MKFSDIPQMTNDGNYRIDVDWTYLIEWVKKEQSEMKLNLDPDFQRGHVWTEDQKTAYIEFCLRGGKGSHELRFNCVGWMGTFSGPFEIVDGKQRLNAVLDFLDNKVKAFGCYIDEFEDSFERFNCSFSIRVNDLKTRKEVLQWYLDINTGGVVHTSEEIDKVKKLLEKEK